MLTGNFAAPKPSNVVTNTDITALPGKVPIIFFWHTVLAAQKINLLPITIYCHF
jgi:hypothetical protein